jgi:hypothetical protein
VFDCSISPESAWSLTLNEILELQKRYKDYQTRQDTRVANICYVVAKKLGDKKARHSDFMPGGKEKTEKTPEQMAAEARIFAAAMGGE